MRALLGDEDLEQWRLALEATPPCSVRENPSHQRGLPHSDPVPWCRLGHYLPQRPVFTLDPLFHAGAYYVQEASSMLVEQAFKTTGLEGQKVVALDLCAAPGGKSGLLRTLLHPSSLLISNEVNPARAEVLAENLWKQGAQNTLITRLQATYFGQWKEYFDLVMLDAPCSGEGLMRKDRFARQQWTPRLVDKCAVLQSALLEDAWKALRPGGHLIYSTCTWSTEENELQIDAFAQRNAAAVVPIPVHDTWKVRTSPLGLRCYPHECRGEGFFLSLLRKPGNPPRPAINSDAASYLLEQNGVVHMLSSEWWPTAMRLYEVNQAFVPGLPIARSERGRWVPHAVAAYSRTAQARLGGLLSFSVLDLDATQALTVLRGESPRSGDAQGWALARFQGAGLAWLKGAGTRWNNHLPKPWRIRMRTGGV